MGIRLPHNPMLGGIILFVTVFATTIAYSQKALIDGLPFSPYKSSDFRGKINLKYQLYVSPLLTVDPLGLGGRSAYALGVGARVNIWESKEETTLLSGLRLRGVYGALGYEYFPQQFDNVYGSIWFRIRTFIPISARVDALYSFGEGRQGIASRFCFGVEVKQFALLLSGTIYSALSRQIFGEHPIYHSEYSNAGGIMLIIPVYHNKSLP